MCLLSSKKWYKSPKNVHSVSLELDTVKRQGKICHLWEENRIESPVCVCVCVCMRARVPKGQTTPNRIAVSDQIGNRKTDVL